MQAFTLVARVMCWFGLGLLGRRQDDNMMARDMMNDRQDISMRGESPLDGGLGEVVSLVMPLRGGMWYAMVRDEGLQGRADMMFGTRESAEAWVLDVLEGVALERALNGENLADVEMGWEEAAEAA